MRVITVLLGLAALCGTACASAPRTTTWLAPFFRASGFVSASGNNSVRARKTAPRGSHARSAQSSAALIIERSLHARGLRFGTDGSLVALYAYMRGRHEAVRPDEARPGDVLFFATGSDPTDCAGHAALVERVDGDGRISFREARAGSERISFLHPRAPLARRDTSGRVINTFLRPKRQDDAPGTRYFAGDMLCEIRRPEP